MKKLIVTLAAMVLATSAFAQLNFGVKVGGNLANISGIADNLGVFDHEVGNASKSNTTQSMKLGFNAGVYAEYMVMPMLGIQVEANFSMQGVNANNVTDTAIDMFDNSTDYTWSANYINIPILAKLHVGPIRAYVGPQLGFATGMNTTTKFVLGNNTNVQENVVEDYNSFDFSLVLGAQYKITGNIGVDARYNIGMTNVFPAVKNNNDEVVTEAWGKQGVLQLGVFYEF